MDPYTPKTFAVGEILTAQDVNEYLSNPTKRHYFLNDEMFVSREFNITQAYSVLEESLDGPIDIAYVYVRFEDVPRDEGANNTLLGVLVAALSPSNAQPLSAYTGNNSSRVSVLSSGDIALRWSNSGSSGGALNISGSYPILKE